MHLLAELFPHKAVPNMLTVCTQYLEGYAGLMLQTHRLCVFEYRCSRKSMRTGGGIYCETTPTVMEDNAGMVIHIWSCYFIFLLFYFIFYQDGQMCKGMS